MNKIQGLPRWAASAFLISAVALVGCTTASYKNIKTTRYYGYQVAGSADLDREGPPTPPKKATDAIKKLKRVAFVPPDSCLDMRAGDTSTTVNKRVIRMRCGVTMSELEREAERVGFDVVTWQSLKGERPLEKAKEQNIGLIFEVNELDVVEEHDRNESVEFQYFQGDGDGPPKRLKVTRKDNDTCKAYHAENGPEVSGMTSVLDLKMVRVKTGSVLWSYRHVENAEAASKSSLIRFPVGATQHYKTGRAWWPWLVVAGGVVVMVAADPLIGAGIAGAGLLGLLILPKTTNPAGPRKYEPVSSVLCRRPHIVPGAVEPVVKRDDDVSDTFRSERRVRTKDPLEERRRELIRKSVQVFMSQLTDSESDE